MMQVRMYRRGGSAVCVRVAIVVVRGQIELEVMKAPYQFSLNDKLSMILRNTTTNENKVRPNNGETLIQASS